MWIAVLYKQDGKMKTTKQRRLKMVKLYKIKNGEIKLVDYGVPEKADIYTAQGYIVVY